MYSRLLPAARDQLPLITTQHSEGHLGIFTMTKPLKTVMSSDSKVTGYKMEEWQSYLNSNTPGLFVVGTSFKSRMEYTVSDST
jgi:hypothetical protein